MKRGALDHGDEIGGRARAFSVGELDDAIGPERAGDRVDRRKGAGSAERMK